MQSLTPAWEGYLADPFILRTRDGYFAFGTDGPEHRARSANGREFPVLFSPDLHAWTFLGGALDIPVDLKESHFWAPEVIERDGRFFLYYSAGGEQGEGQKLCVATSNTPEGPYLDEGRPLLAEEPFSIDADPFLDPKTGETFLYFAKDFFDEPVGTGIAVVGLDSSLLQIRGKPKTILRAHADWQVYEEDRVWYGQRWPRWSTCEGPSVVFRHGRYYLFFSGGNWQKEGYGVSFAVADRPEGPFSVPFLEGGATVLRSIPGTLIGPGHNCILGDDPGPDFIVFHAWDRSLQKRQMYVEPLEWRAREGILIPAISR